jgi:hypothetical protein
MNPFDPIPPEWIRRALHGTQFCCPSCQSPNREAQAVWINRQAPVYTPDQQRKWQEFYHCGCGASWWGWSSDRPPSEFSNEFSNQDPQP